MRKSIRIGDVIEIVTSKGLAYAQYTHEHSSPPGYGSLIRVLPGFYDERPRDFSELVKAKHRFVKFFPLRAAVREGIVTILANEPVPPEAKEFPIFRAGVADPKTGKVKAWWFWDGEKSWKVGRITKKQRKMPIRGLVNDTKLVELIESGWTPENDACTLPVMGS